MSIENIAGTSAPAIENAQELLKERKWSEAYDAFKTLSETQNTSEVWIGIINAISHNRLMFDTSTEQTNEVRRCYDNIVALGEMPPFEISEYVARIQQILAKTRYTYHKRRHELKNKSENMWFACGIYTMFYISLTLAAILSWVFFFRDGGPLLAVLGSVYITLAVLFAVRCWQTRGRYLKNQEYVDKMAEDFQRYL